MIFRSRKRRETTTAVQVPLGGEPLGAEADDALDPVEELSGEELFERIDALSRENRAARDPQIERRLLRLRHRAGARLVDHPSADPQHPAPAFDMLPNGSGLPPDIPPRALTAELLRAGVLRNGCLLVRGLLDMDDASRLAGEIEAAFQARDAVKSGGSVAAAYYEEFEPDAPYGPIKLRPFYCRRRRRSGR